MAAPKLSLLALSPTGMALESSFLLIDGAVHLATAHSSCTLGTGIYVDVQDHLYLE